jgi:uncharacterized protein (DUF1697 family)
MINKKVKKWLDEGNVLLENANSLTPEIRDEITSFLKKILDFPKKNNRLYLIVNEGVHPIVEDLKKQYGADIRYEVVTRGNVSLDEEAQIARRVKEIVEANHGAEFVIVPSGLPYIVTVVYNTVLQITSKHPVYLQLDREKGRYIEKTLDPRKLMF